MAKQKNRKALILPPYGFKTRLLYLLRRKYKGTLSPCQMNSLSPPGPLQTTFFILRRITAPKKPAPNNASVAGSGTIWDSCPLYPHVPLISYGK